MKNTASMSSSIGPGRGGDEIDVDAPSTKFAPLRVRTNGPDHLSVALWATCQLLKITTSPYIRRQKHTYLVHVKGTCISQAP